MTIELPPENLAPSQTDGPCSPLPHPEDNGTVGSVSPRTKIQSYLQFLDSSPTSYHAVASARQRFLNAGFTELDERDRWDSMGPGAYFVTREGAVAAWIVPSVASEAGEGSASVSRETRWRILGAHTDSPMFKLKPSGNSFTGDGWGELDVEVYGGALWNSWLDRELCLAGRVLFRREAAQQLGIDGAELSTAMFHVKQSRDDDEFVEVLICLPHIARIPQLAIHLDHGQNKALSLDPQQHLHPVWTVDNPHADIFDTIVATLQQGAQDAAHRVHGDSETHAIGRRAGRELIAGFDLYLCAQEKANRFGARGEFIAAGRQDNLSSVWGGVEAIIEVAKDGVIAAADDAWTIPLFVANDHEEVGSGSWTGACGNFLELVMERIAAALGADRGDVVRGYAHSLVVSSDAGHSVHPNYPGKHDPTTRPVMGRGPMIKINAQQRYATDGVGEGIWRAAAERAGEPVQAFASNNAMPCGSTIGPLTATRLGIRTVDVGVGLLSMHSAREMSHCDDIVALTKIMKSYLAEG